MNKAAGLPVEGKAIRFAPARDQEPASAFWKIWSEGNEIYALARTSGGAAKISVHASGQIHYRLGPKLKQDIAPLMQLGSGPWMHAFEMRFLLSEGARAPTKEERESLKNKSARLIPVPKGLVLYANLIIGRPGTPPNGPIPVEFAGGQPLWRTDLRDGRPAVLVGRMLPLDSQNRDNIKFLRETLKPTITLASMAAPPYVEVVQVKWTLEGGNVLLVVPMGDEAVRSEQEMTVPIGPTGDPRRFQYQSRRSAVDIVAPNGLRVAVLEFDSVDRLIELVKNLPSTHEVGTLKMKLQPSNLIPGSKFMASPCRLESIPTVGGGSPRNWGYTAFASFDGFALSVEINQNSASLRNSNAGATVSQLDDSEELVVAIPWQKLKLLATMDAPVASMEVVGRFTLRDSR